MLLEFSSNLILPLRYDFAPHHNRVAAGDDAGNPQILESSNPGPAK
jgi:hypothetical protein